MIIIYENAEQNIQELPIEPKEDSKLELEEPQCETPSGNDLLFGPNESGCCVTVDIYINGKKTRLDFGRRIMEI